MANAIADSHVLENPQAGKGNRQPGTDNRELPPFLKSWGRIYSLVLSFLVFLILLMYIFMRFFS